MRSSAPRAGKALPIAFLLTAAAAGCASAPQVLHLGDSPDLGVTLALADSVGPPVNLDITLSQPAHIAVLRVVPGQGATLVYPRDTSLGPTHFTGGQHRVRAWYPGMGLPPAADPALRTPEDSVFDVRRPGTISDTSQRARGRVGLGDRMDEPRQPRTPLVPTYLLVVATPAPLDPETIRRRVEGVTIPLNEQEALNAIGKLVRSTAQPGARWAGHAIPLTTRTAAPARRQG